MAALREKLGAMFPPAREAALEHAWSGVLGVPRDWCVSVDADPGSGLAWAGGYVGEGVAAANLAGRTLRDLMLGEPTAHHEAAVGGAQRHGAGSPSRCAGPASAASTRCTALPTAASGAADDPHGLAAALDVVSPGAS